MRVYDNCSKSKLNSVKNDTWICRYTGRMLQLWSQNNSPLDIVGWILLLTIGMLLGAIAGQYSGWYVGEVYTEEYAPVYFSGYANFVDLESWIELPYRFTVKGQIIGGLLGPFFAIIMAIIYAKSISRRTE